MTKHESRQPKQGNPVCRSILPPVKVWATLIFDDMRGIPPQMYSMDEHGLQFVLVRSKSTGPGKYR
eukprot:4205632-Amphidinium_carterae.5